MQRIATLLIFALTTFACDDETASREIIENLRTCTAQADDRVEQCIRDTLITLEPDFMEVPASALTSVPHVSKKLYDANCPVVVGGVTYYFNQGTELEWGGGKYRCSQGKWWAV